MTSPRSAWRSMKSRFGLVPPVQQRVLALTHVADPSAPARLHELQHSCRGARLPLDTWNMAEAAPPSLGRWTCVVIVTGLPDVPDASLAARLSRFVESGGGLVAIQPAPNRFLSALFGIGGVGDRSPATWETLRFHGDVFAGMRDTTLELAEMPPTVPYALAPDTGARPLVTEGDGVLAWCRRHGDGNVFVWNCGLPATRLGRGVLVQSILAAQPVGVQAIANAASIQIDDFPAGVIDAEREPVASEFGLSYLAFLDKVWLPDLLDLGRAYGIPFTFALPFTYNEQVAPPFPFTEWEHEKHPSGNGDVPYAVAFAHRAGAHGELALHGYNHVPLTRSLWTSRGAMAAALSAAMERWERDGLGPQPSAYVPPMNDYDADGARALTEAIPTMKVVCGMYWDDPETSVVREFEAEPWNGALFCLPRVSWGYELTDETRWGMLSLLDSIGAWTHFFHPDDIVDVDQVPGASYEPRNPDRRRWRDAAHGSLRNALRGWLDEVAAHAPWLRYMRATDAATAIRRHLENPVDVRFRRGGIDIRAGTPTDLQIRVSRFRERSLGPLRNLELLHHHEGSDYDLYTVRMLGTAGSMALRRRRRVAVPRPNAERDRGRGSTP